jgi:hypothetical protein
MVLKMGASDEARGGGLVATVVGDNDGKGRQASLLIVGITRGKSH